MSSLQGLAETIRRHGPVEVFFTDRGSHHVLTPEAGGKVNKHNLIQVSRALVQFGIRQIPSHSPETLRTERAFGTLQGRIPQELRINGHATAEAAKRVYMGRLFA